jgi:hypothetical protein
MTAVKKMDDQAIAPAQELSMVSMIERIAMDPTIPLDRLERMLEMKERMEDRQREDEARQAQKAFFVAMSAAQAEIKPVARTQTNGHTKSKYADIEAISDAIQPIITKQGFALTFSEEECPKPNHMRVVCDVMHVEGHCRTYRGDVPIDAAGSQGKANKNATQAYGSTKSYGRRYLKLDIFDVPVKGKDTDGNTPEAEPAQISPEQLAELQGLIDRSGADIQWICNHYKVESLAAMNVKQFHHSTMSLKQRIAALEKQKAATNG